MTLKNVMIRVGIAATLAVGGTSHAYLYLRGYRHIPMIGSAFALEASLSFAMAVLILLGGPAWLRWVAAAVAGGALLAFLLSRTTGLLGFSERGWEPSPYAAVSAVAELLTVGLWGLAFWHGGFRSTLVRVARARHIRAR